MRLLKKKIRRQLLFFILKHKRFKLHNAILLFSDPRGGSTWLMEVLSQLPRTISNREPLQGHHGVVPKEFGFGWYPLIPVESRESKYIDFFEKVLCFKLFNDWNTRSVSLKKLIFSKFVITKFVLGNQLLPWIAATFNNQLNYKPIYLLRHPVAVCMSQLNTIAKIKPTQQFLILPKSKRFKIFETLNNERFIKHEGYLSSLETKMEIQVALWCINNKNLLNEKQPHWVMVYYEDLLLNPDKEFDLLLKNTGLDKMGGNTQKINFRKPSSTVYNSKLLQNPEDQLSKFTNIFTYDELQKLQNVLDYFEIKIYNAFNPYPLKNNK
jgi:hypothetical protein